MAEKIEKILKSICGSPDHPLIIGDIAIPCYVLEDDTRVLVQRGLQSGLGMGYTVSRQGGNRLTRFLEGKRINPCVSNSLKGVLINPIKFRSPSGLAFGYPATILVDICEAVLKARDEGRLWKQQLHIAERCDVLIRAFARVGIIALIDEATGFQEVRTRFALVRILERFIAEDLQPWVKTFDDAFYKEIFRLNDWPYRPESIKRPGVIGHWTNDIIYERLAPGVREELHRIVERDDKGRPKHRLFQRLTSGVGHPKLREHLAAVIAVMKLSNTWRRFMANLNIALPKWGDTYMLLDEKDENFETNLKDYLKVNSPN